MNRSRLWILWFSISISFGLLASYSFEENAYALTWSRTYNLFPPSAVSKGVVLDDGTYAVKFQNSIMRIDVFGNILWQKQLNVYKANSIVQLANGDLAVGGEADGAGGLDTGQAWV